MALQSRAKSVDRLVFGVMQPDSQPPEDLALGLYDGVGGGVHLVEVCAISISPDPQILPAVPALGSRFQRHSRGDVPAPGPGTGGFRHSALPIGDNSAGAFFR